MKTEIIKLLKVAYPTYEIYDKGFTPQNFTRPCFCIVTHPSKHTRLNINLCQRTEKYEIVCFETLDDYGYANSEKIVDDVCRLFDSGKVGRSNVIQVDGDIGFNEGYVDITLEYYDTVRTEQGFDEMEKINLEVRT